MNNVNSKSKTNLTREWLINGGLFLAIVALGIHLHAAATINFVSDTAATNLQSDGVSMMNATYSFQLGTFANGFVPTAANTDLWTANWEVVPLIDSIGDPIAGNETSYNQDEVFPGSGIFYNNFQGKGQLATNDSPFQTSSTGYIWGYTDKEGANGSTAEWILITNSSWVFPEANPAGPPINAIWGVGDAGTTAVLGQVNTVDAHMESASVTLVPEPSAALLAGLSLSLFALRRRRF
jgi:hypothetical protein